MKADLPDHRKFLRLCRLLNEPEPHVIGYLYFMWRRCYQMGTPVLGDELDVEVSACYRGPVGAYTKAALESNLIELTDDGRYKVHDLFDHAPTWAKKRLDRRGHAPPGAEGYAGSGTPRGRSTRTAKSVPPNVANDELQRPNMELFQAIAEVCQSDVSLKRVAKQVTDAADDLAKAIPPYTPIEVRTFGIRFTELCSYAVDDGRMRPYPTEVASKICLIRGVDPQPGNSNGSNSKPARRVGRVAPPADKYSALDPGNSQAESATHSTDEDGAGASVPRDSNG